MHCKNCGGNRVAWVGPLSALTHTECADCGAKNCQVEEGENPSVGTGPKQGRFASLPVVATPPTDAAIQEPISKGGDHTLSLTEKVVAEQWRERYIECEDFCRQFSLGVFVEAVKGLADAVIVAESYLGTPAKTLALVKQLAEETNRLRAENAALRAGSSTDAQDRIRNALSFTLEQLRCYTEVHGADEDDQQAFALAEEALHKVAPCVPNADEIQCADVIVQGKDHYPDGKTLAKRPLTRDEVAFLIAAYTHAEVDGKMIPAKEIRDILVRVRTSWVDFEAGVKSVKTNGKTETASRLVWWIARLALHQKGHIEPAKVGDMVVEVTHLMGLARHQLGLLTAVGELVAIEDDSGVNHTGKIYAIKGLDGKVTRWGNADVVAIERAPTKTPDLDKEAV